MIGQFAMHLFGAILFLTIFVSAVAFTGFGNDKEFSSEAWLNSNARDRGRIAESLVRGESLVGLSANEVRLQLGDAEKDWGRVHQYQIDLGWPMKTSTSYGL